MKKSDPRFAVNLDLPNSTLAEPVIGKYLGTEANPGLNDVKVFRSSEMYLIRAEAYANQDKLISAAADMDLLRTARASSATPAYTTKQEAIDDIMSERRIELAFEGHRFFDLKRSNSGFDRSDKKIVQLRLELVLLLLQITDGFYQFRSKKSLLTIIFSKTLITIQIKKYYYEKNIHITITFDTCNCVL